jgi:hypothetical protein
MVRSILLLLSGMLLIGCAPRNSDKKPIPQTSQANIAVNESHEKNQRDIMGQTVYVPIYSHIYLRSKSMTMNLAATLSIRNTDAQNSIRITSVRFYDTNGKLIKTLINEPMRVLPMATAEFVIADDDTSGGSGANFIVEWTAGVTVTEPIVEAVMIGGASQQGISFIGNGRVIKSWALPN